MSNDKAIFHYGPDTKGTDTSFVNFRTGLKHPKLSWLTQMLDKYGIKWRLSNGLKGRMLQVQVGSLDIAAGILTQELVTLDITVDGAEDIQNRPVVITIDDLPDDHMFFDEFMARSLEAAGTSASTVADVAVEFAQEGTKVDGVNDATTETEEVPVEDAGAEFDKAIGLKLVAPPVQEEDEDVSEDDEEAPDEISWDFDEDDEDEDEQEAIDVEHRVIDESESDPEFKAEVVPPAEPKPRKKKEKRDAVDPDFAVAEEPATTLSQPLDGTEFLQADDLLVFEDVTFPEVKQPIRMYDVDSSNVSRIGAKVLNNDPQIVTFYVQYKGGIPYRYNPVTRADWNEALNLAIRKHKGIQEASVGSFIYNGIRILADEGTIKCQRLDGETWVKVLPKAERTRQIKNRDK